MIKPIREPTGLLNDTRRFAIADMESIVRYSDERYFDVETRRLMASEKISFCGRIMAA